MYYSEDACTDGRRCTSYVDDRSIVVGVRRLRFFFRKAREQIKSYVVGLLNERRRQTGTVRGTKRHRQDRESIRFVLLSQLPTPPRSPLLRACVGFFRFRFVSFRTMMYKATESLFQFAENESNTFYRRVSASPRRGRPTTIDDDDDGDR